MDRAECFKALFSDAEERQIFAVSVAARDGRGDERLRIKTGFFRRMKKGFDNRFMNASVTHDSVLVQVFAARFKLRLDETDERTAAAHRAKNGGINESL